MYDRFLNSLSGNARFPDNVLLKPKYIDRIGFKIQYEEGTECVIWTDGEKYYAILDLFSETHFLRIPQSLGDNVYEKFYKAYEGNFSYQYL
jgi:hypothetical protein